MKRAQGNALFLILIAVALFAALSYAITSSSRGGSGISKEQTEILTAQIFQRLTAIEQGLTRFLIVNNYTLSDIDMFPGADDAYNGNTNACSDDECNLFHVNGGGVSSPALPASMGSQGSCPGLFFAADGSLIPYIKIQSVEGVGTVLSDIVLDYCGVALEICQKINQKVGIKDLDDPALTFFGGSWPGDYNSFSATYTDPLADTVDNYLGTSLDARLNGYRTFCSEDPNVRHLYHVIYAR